MKSPSVAQLAPVPPQGCDTLPCSQSLAASTHHALKSLKGNTVLDISPQKTNQILSSSNNREFSICGMS